MANSGGTDIDSGPAGGEPPLPTPPTRRGGSVIAISSGILLALGIVLIALLPVQWFAAYFTIWTPVTIDEGEMRLYAVTASACLITLGSSLVLAFVARRRGLAWASGLLLIVGIAAVLVFAVPQARWVQVDDVPQPLPSNYEPCYSGSNDCGGGG